MSVWSTNVAVSPNDRIRIAAIDLLAQSGAAAVGALVEQLADESWVVRRRLVSALASLGDAATPALCELLAQRRPSEAAIAAAVDALSASSGSPDEALSALTRSTNPAVVCDAAQVMGRRGSVRSIPLLAQLIAHPDDNVAVAAIEALGRIGGEQALDSVMAAAASDRFFRVFPTIEVLGQSGDFRAVGPLTKLLDNPLYESAAARALASIGGSQAVRALVAKLLLTSELSLLGPIAISLGELSQRAVEGPEVVDATRSAGAALVAKLQPLLASRDDAERIAAARLIGGSEEGAAAEALLPLLDVMGPVGEAGATALLRLHDDGGRIGRLLREGASVRRAVLLPLISLKRHAADVAEALTDPDPNVRTLACASLARLGDASVVARVFPLLQDSDVRVGQGALAAIQSLGGAQTQQLTLAAAASADAKLQRYAFRIIGYFGYPDALELTLGGSKSSDGRVRDAAIQALPFIPKEAALARLVELTADPVPTLRASAMRALSHIAELPPAALKALRSGLNDSDPWVRYFAAQTAGRLGDEASEPLLLQLVRDPAGQVRLAAIEALARMASDTAHAVLAKAAASPDADEQRAALVGLGIAKHPDALAVLTRALEAAEPSTRLVALSALTNFGEELSLPAILRAAGDADEGVRTAAVALLATSTGPGANAALIDLVSDRRVHKQVVAALSISSSARIAAIVEALETADDASAIELVRALRMMSNDAGWRPLLSAMTTAGAPGRRAAAKMLALSGSAEARAVLRRAASSDPEPDIRKLCELAAGAD